jgi:recombination endonuclease VII
MSEKAERQRLRRQRIKEDPEAYKVYRSKRNKYAKQRWKSKPRGSPELQVALNGRPYIEVYDELVSMRGEICWICGGGRKSRRLDIDHCHRTNKIRGLLCAGCNRKLGWLEIFRKDIVRYLRDSG